MLAPALIMGLGLTAGIEHAFEPDHIAAISTQISKSKFAKKSTKQLLKESSQNHHFLGCFGVQDIPRPLY